MSVEFDKDGFAVVPGEIRVYYYDRLTGEYSGWSDEYISEGVTIPGNSTITEPNEDKKGNAQVYVDGVWEYREDHRGETAYSTETMRSENIEYIGDVKKDYTLKAPSTIFDKWNGKEWVTDVEAQKADEVLKVTLQKNTLIAEATVKIAPLLDAKEGGYIDEEDLPVLTAWQKYRYALTKVDVNKPVWPEKPA